MLYNLSQQFFSHNFGQEMWSVVCSLNQYQDYISAFHRRTGHEVIKLLSFSTQLNMKVIMLINAEMLTTVGILTFISRVNTPYERFKPRKILYFQHISFYELKFHAQLS